MPDDFLHKGTVTAIDGHAVTLRPDADDARSCDACALRWLCDNKSAETLTLNTVSVPDGVIAGSRVKASIADATRQRAIIMQLIVPCALFLAFVLGLNALGVAPVLSVLAAFGGVGLWQLVLWACRGAISRSVKWTITPIIEQRWK